MPAGPHGPGVTARDVLTPLRGDLAHRQLEGVVERLIGLVADPIRHRRDTQRRVSEEASGDQAAPFAEILHTRRGQQSDRAGQPVSPSVAEGWFTTEVARWREAGEHTRHRVTLKDLFRREGVGQIRRREHVGVMNPLGLGGVVLLVENAALGFLVDVRR